MRSPKVVLGSSLTSRFKALCWGTWALSRAYVHADPDPGSYAFEIDQWTALPSEWVWLIAGVLLVVGSAPPVTQWPAVTCALRACRIGGINLVAALTAVWLVGSMRYQDLAAASTNLLIVELACISAYTIARERAARGDLPNAK